MMPSSATATADSGAATGRETVKPAQKIRQRFFRTKALDRLPVCLTHDRIYILPTRRGLLFLGGLLVMLIASMNYALGLGYALCFLLTGLVSAALLATYQNLKGITLESASSNATSVGESLDFSLSLANPNKSSIYLLSVSDNNDNQTLVPELAPRDSGVAVLSIPATRRGWLQLGRLTLRSEFPLGLWFAWGYWHVPLKELVLPASEAEPPGLPEIGSDENQNNEHEQSESTARSGDIRGIREYLPGDTPSAIDWKASARGIGLHTREFEQHKQPELLNLSWQHTRALTDIEARVSRLAAWCRQCHREERPFTLQLPGQVVIDTALASSDTATPGNPANTHNTGEAHLYQCLKALALFNNSSHGANTGAPE